MQGMIHKHQSSVSIVIVNTYSVVARIYVQLEWSQMVQDATVRMDSISINQPMSVWIQLILDAFHLQLSSHQLISVSC